MQTPEPAPDAPAIRGLRQAMMHADDAKIRRIVALLDSEAMPGSTQAILDPLRPRLARLRPPRRLRFGRLLFLPLDPVIVSAATWRPGAATIPRSVLGQIEGLVRAGLGAETDDIVALIEGRTTDQEEAIDAAGTRLWPRAADILAQATVPAGWDATGLPPAMFAPLAKALAALLRRVVALRTVVRDAEVGALELQEDAISALLVGLAADAPEACGMMVTILLARLPHAAMRLRALVATSLGAAERVQVRTLLDQGLDETLTGMEGKDAFKAEILDAPLDRLGTEVRRIAALLRDVEDDKDTAKHRPRLRQIRTKVDEVCRTRFTTALTEEVIAPLSAREGPVDGDAQIRIENSARDLRALETAARPIGSARHYETLLGEACDAVAAAEGAGAIGLIQKLRLVEILAGADAAEAMYKAAPAPFAAAKS